jgi:cellulose synthase/poly-beta-1,6-N-acetylglucosamine synthase-like glycosyltransferase
MTRGNPEPPGNADASDAAATDALPGVSYVMPVLNEVDHIEAAVLSLINQDYAGPFEVVLALGPSVDGTNRVIDEMAQADSRIRSIPNELGSTPGGLNAAIRASSHPIVIRVDAHSVLPREYTRLGVATLLRSGADNVGGIMKAEGVTPFEKAVAHAYGAKAGLGGTPHHIGGAEGPAETAYLGIFQRHRLVEVGLFDEDIGGFVQPAEPCGSRPNCRWSTDRAPASASWFDSSSPPGSGAENWPGGSHVRTASATSCHRRWCSR